MAATHMKPCPAASINALCVIPLSHISQQAPSLFMVSKGLISVNFAPAVDSEI